MVVWHFFHQAPPTLPLGGDSASCRRCGFFVCVSCRKGQWDGGMRAKTAKIVLKVLGWDLEISDKYVSFDTYFICHENMFACYLSVWDSTSLIDRPRSQTGCLAFSLPASFWITGSQQQSWWSLAVFASFCFLCFFFLSLCRVHRVGFAFPCVRFLVGFDPVIATLQLGDCGHLGDNLERILMDFDPGLHVLIVK